MYAYTITPKAVSTLLRSIVVLKQVGSMAYQLQLPEASRIHPVFHASQLKLVVGTHPIEKKLPNELHEQVSVFFSS